MAIDRRYQATLEKVKLHSSFLAGNSSFLAGKKSTAQTSGGSDDGASAPMNMCDSDPWRRMRDPTGFDLSVARQNPRRWSAIRARSYTRSRRLRLGGARHPAARAAAPRASCRKKSSWRVDLFADGLTVHDRHGLACRTPLWLRWDGLGRRRWWRGRRGRRAGDWLLLGGGRGWR